MIARQVRAHRSLVLAVALVGLPAFAVAAAWISDLVDSGTSFDPDYLWQPLDISSTTRLVLGLTATVVAAGAIVLVWRWFRTASISRSVVIVLAAGAAIAGYLGVMYSVATAPVIGANIGGGLMLLAAGPFIGVTIALATVAVVQQRRRTDLDRPDLQV